MCDLMAQIEADQNCIFLSTLTSNVIHILEEVRSHEVNGRGHDFGSQCDYLWWNNWFSEEEGEVQGGSDSPAELLLRPCYFWMNLPWWTS